MPVPQLANDCALAEVGISFHQLHIHLEQGIKVLLGISPPYVHGLKAHTN